MTAYIMKRRRILRKSEDGYMERRYKVKGEEKYVIKLNEFSNGIETTGGIYSEDKLEEVYGALSITYDSDHAIELPVYWRSMLFLDDSNKRQMIKHIHFNESPAYEMADGSMSYEVTS